MWDSEIESANMRSSEEEDVVPRSALPLPVSSLSYEELLSDCWEGEEVRVRIAGRRCLGAWEFERIDFQQTPAMNGRIQSPSIPRDRHEGGEFVARVVGTTVFILSLLSSLHREGKGRKGESGGREMRELRR